MKYSILIPVYNVEKYVTDCLQSLMNQSFADWEAVAVDDGSTDSSGSICDAFAGKDNRIKVYHKENGGLIQARDYAIGRASGEYCLFVDSDDWLEPDALERIDAHIKEDRPDCLIFGFRRMVDGKELSRVGESEQILISDKRELYLRCFTDLNYNSVCRKTVRRELLKDDYSDYYGLSISEDLLRSVDILKKSTKVLFIPDILYNYRDNPNSITNTVRYENYESGIEIRKFVLRFLQSENVLNKADLSVLRDFNLILLIRDINTIGLLHTDAGNKIKLFDALKDDDYYSGYLSAGIEDNALSISRNAFLKAFKEGNYKLVLTMIGINEKRKALLNH